VAEDDAKAGAPAPLLDKDVEAAGGPGGGGGVGTANGGASPPPAGGPDPPPRPALAASLPHTMSAGGTTVTASWWHLFKAWAPLGYTTFGGPSAHVGQYLLVR